MQEWDESSDQVTKLTSDKEKAKALLRLVELREKDLSAKGEEFATLIVEQYYEVVKELATAIMSIDGYKTLSHELLVGYIAKFYKEFTQSEVYLMDQLRKTRNDIAYRGVLIKPEYLKRNKVSVLEIISKLKYIVIKKIES